MEDRVIHTATPQPADQGLGFVTRPPAKLEHHHRHHSEAPPHPSPLPQAGGEGKGEGASVCNPQYLR